MNDHGQDKGCFVECELPSNTGAFTVAEGLVQVHGSFADVFGVEALGIECFNAVAPFR